MHGLAGDIREANSYYDDLHDAVDAFDFVMANPPFNVNKVDRERLRGDTARFPFGMPSADNGNYLWIQIFYSSLGPTGRGGFVMANSAADARGSEMEIRRRLLDTGAVDVIVAVAPNFFYTVTLPVTLWFFDRGKRATSREDRVLFVDARRIFRQVNRALRDFEDDQLEFLANVVRLYRGVDPTTTHGSKALLEATFPDGYRDVPGLCRAVPRGVIASQNWSLNPGRYVGVEAGIAEDADFSARLEELSEELGLLMAEARGLEEDVTTSISGLLDL